MKPLFVNISVVEAKGLKKKEIGKYDPFVELRYLNKSQNTKVIKNNPSPTWNDCFEYHIDASKPVMNLLVWDKEIFFLSNNLIGAVVLDWTTVSVELERGKTVDKWYPVERTGKPEPIRGWLHLILKGTPVVDKSTATPSSPLSLSKSSKIIDPLPIINSWCLMGRNKEVNISISSKPLSIEPPSNSSSIIGSTISDISIDSGCSSSGVSSRIKESGELTDEDILYHCMQCTRKENPSNLFLMEECLHNFCRFCLKTRILRQLEFDPTNFQCLNDSCIHKIHPSIIKDVLDSLEFERYLKVTLELVVESSACFFKCPNCLIAYEKLEPKKDQKNKKLHLVSPSGARMTEEAAKHRDENRFRCGNCSTEFCSSCKSVPYHYTFNCDEYKCYLVSRKCRFCKSSLLGVSVSDDYDQTLPGHLNICSSLECQEKKALCCGKRLGCGHNCMGIAGEEQCPPCFKAKCQPKKSKQVPLNSRDLCNICYYEELSTAPCVQLECGHAFHFACMKNRIQQRFNHPRMSFKHLECPLCNRLMKHPALTEIMGDQLKMRDVVRSKASQRLVFEGLHKSKEILDDKHSKWYRNPDAYAMDHYSYYLCFKCKVPYFAGQVRCDQGNNENEFNPEDLICPSCKGESYQKCNIHGWDFMEFKCHFCCSVASFFCWGKIHFCDTCHTKQQKGDYLTKKPKSMIPMCPGIDQCPLKLVHPHCEEFSLGCSICKMIKEF